MGALQPDIPDLEASSWANQLYKPLNDTHGDSIRILRLYHGSADDKLYVSLDEVRLRDEPEYFALSYTWASGGPARKLYMRENVSDRFLAIRPNVDFVLRRLRRELAKGESINIWIDAICINQDDLLEKSNQVIRMGRIYAQAKKVIVFLGYADGQTEIGLKAVELLARSGAISEDSSGYDQLSEAAEDDGSLVYDSGGEDLESGEGYGDVDLSGISDTSQSPPHPGFGHHAEPGIDLSSPAPVVQVSNQNLKRKRTSTNSATSDGDRRQIHWAIGDYDDGLLNTTRSAHHTQITHTLKCLDLAAEDERIALLFDQIQVPTPPRAADFAIEKLQRDLPGTAQALASLDPQAGIESVLQCFLSIYDRPWYSRIWIQQEVILAAKIDVMIGEFDLTWEQLVAADMTCFVEDLRLGPDIGVCAVLEAKRRMQSGSDPQFVVDTLLSHASYARQVNSSDARDKIYGWLGLVSPEHTTVTPDYTVSTAETYRCFTEVMIRHYHDLTILTMCGPGVPSDRPSWVPDFSTRSDKEDLGLSSFRTAYSKFSAAASSKPLTRSVSSDILVLQGIVVDEIIATSVSFRRSRHESRIPETRTDTIDLVFIAWKSIAEKFCPDPYHSGETLGDAFRQTLVQHRNPRDANVLSTKGDSVFQMLLYHLDNALPNLQDVSSDDLREYLLREINQPESSSWVLGYIAVQLAGLRMFVTRSGYMGLGYHNVVKGDKLALFSGGNMPFLIRSAGSSYSLVSAAYVHGMMDGAMWRSEQANREDLKLR